MNRAGDVVGGYRLIQVLGQGPLGVVWQARDPQQRRVAVKLLRPELAGRSGATAAFERLAAAVQGLRRVEHPALCAPLAPLYVPEAGALGMASAFVEGIDLADVAPAEPSPLAPASLRRSVEWLLDVLGGLGHAHANGYVHGNLKLSNIRVGPSPQGAAPVVLDLAWSSIGVSPAAADERFLSPEQRAGEQASEASDLYAVAAIWRHLLHPGASRLPEGLPPEIALVLRRALSEQPAARFRSAEDMAEALRPALEALPADTAGAVPGSGAEARVSADPDPTLESRPPAPLRASARGTDAPRAIPEPPARVVGGEARLPVGGPPGGGADSADAVPRAASSGASASPAEDPVRWGPFLWYAAAAVLLGAAVWVAGSYVDSVRIEGASGEAIAMRADAAADPIHEPLAPARSASAGAKSAGSNVSASRAGGPGAPASAAAVPAAEPPTLDNGRSPSSAAPVQVAMATKAPAPTRSPAKAQPAAPVTGVRSSPAGAASPPVRPSPAGAASPPVRPSPARRGRVSRPARLSPAAACARGEAAACGRWGDRMLDNGEALPDIRAAFQKGCTLGSATLCLRAARLFTNARSAPDEQSEAQRLAGKACDLGNVRGCRLAHRLAGDGSGGDGDWLRRACALGDRESCVQRRRAATSSGAMGVR